MPSPKSLYPWQVRHKRKEIGQSPRDRTLALLMNVKKRPPARKTSIAVEPELYKP
jgi:hypothetical protein